MSFDENVSFRVVRVLHRITFGSTSNGGTCKPVTSNEGSWKTTVSCFYSVMVEDKRFIVSLDTGFCRKITNGKEN